MYIFPVHQRRWEHLGSVVVCLPHRIRNQSNDSNNVLKISHNYLGASPRNAVDDSGGL